MIKRFLSILMVIMLLITCFVLPISAQSLLSSVTWTYSFPDCTDIIKDKEYLIVTGTSGGKYLITYPKDTNLYALMAYGDDGYWFYPSNDSNSDYASWRQGEAYPSYISILFVNANNQWEFKTGWLKFALGIETKEYYCSKDVQMGHGGVLTSFFYKAPLKLPSQTPMRETMMGAVYLIPYLTVLLIGLVAFWKGWQFLLLQLRRA